MRSDWPSWQLKQGRGASWLIYNGYDFEIHGRAADRAAASTKS